MKHTVSVTELSAYAADPIGHIRSKGKVRNKKAVKHGNRIHDEKELSSYSAAAYWGVFVIVCLAILLVGAPWIF